MTSKLDGTEGGEREKLSFVWNTNRLFYETKKKKKESDLGKGKRENKNKKKKKEKKREKKSFQLKHPRG